MRTMKHKVIIFFAASLCFLIVSFCEAHDAFYPHHLKDVKMAAKRGKILVITLIVSAGLLILVSTAVIRSGKEKEIDAIGNVDPAELRASVIAAVVAGKQGLEESRDRALNMALSAYARARGMEWRNEKPKYSLSEAYAIGKDRVTMSISDDGALVEFCATSGNMSASATANAEDNSTHSSVFSSNLKKRNGRA